MPSPAAKPAPELVDRRALDLRYRAWSFAILTALLLLYRNHPYYANLLRPATQYALLALYAAYVAVTLTAPARGDASGSKILLAAAWLESLPARLRRRLWGPQPAWPEPAPLDAETRTALLSIAVKAFFLPLMLNFFFEHVGTLGQVLLRWPLPAGIPWVVYANFALDALYQAIFLLDTVIFSFGYAVEADRCRNRILSVEPTLLGWVVTLACYPPFNGVTGTLLPDQGPRALFADPSALFALRAAALLCYVVYVWASVALGPRASNLTHRGIVTWGPYRYVRHPAYVAKNLAWWLEKLPWLSSPVSILGLLGFNGLYLLRALTEERHLGMDPEYHAYCQEVRCRFIPGVF